MSQITIQLEPNWTINAHTGDHLTFATTIANVPHTPSVSETIPVAEILKFKPSKIFKHLKKNIGDKIYKGDILATKDGVFSTKKFIADSDGMLTGVNHHLGEITVEKFTSNSEISEIQALLDGIVASIDQKSLVVKVAKTTVIDIKEGLNERVGGKVVLTDNSQAILLSLPQVEGNIIIIDDLSDYVLSKLEALGAKLIITSRVLPKSASICISVSQASDIQAIVDFAPNAMYANATEKFLTFYK